MSNGEMALQWVELIAAARRVADNAEDQSASTDFGTRYGLSLLQTSRIAASTEEERELLMLHSEPWLSGIRRTPARIRARLTSQLRRYRDFPMLPIGIRDAVDELIRELDGAPGR
jgi:hypothetical protein